MPAPCAPEFPPMLPVVVTTLAGQVLFASRVGAEILENFFGNRATLPSVVRRWLASPSARPYSVRHCGRRLVVWRMLGTGDAICLLCLDVVARTAGGELTARELQALYLGHEGLTDRKIGEEILCRRKTVKKHFQNAFAKVGCHKRFAAARLVALASQARALAE